MKLTHHGELLPLLHSHGRSLGDAPGTTELENTSLLWSLEDQEATAPTLATFKTQKAGDQKADDCCRKKKGF